ncbi:MAG: glycoside hydrolase family 18 [Tannerellaceae bacterium]|nr:glycoside hydrolase family 18 [Tannerellaceae bacterium]
MKKIILSVLFLAVMGCFTSCDDWTNPETLGIDNPTIQEENDELYQEYLEEIRKYKKTHHKLLIGWFDNQVKTPASRGQHLESVPDKVDIVSLLHADELSEWELAEINVLQKDKGTRVIYTINYEAFRAEIEEKNLDIEAEEGEQIQMTDVLPAFMDEQLALLEKYPYDGLTIYYNGKLTDAISTAELVEMKAIQQIIFGKLATVINANRDKLFIYESDFPAGIIDKNVLGDFEYIVFRSHNIASIAQLTETVKINLYEGIPADRVIVATTPLSTEDADKKTGTLLGENGTNQNAITEMAYWVTTADSFTKAGLGVYRINDDYYNADLDYKLTREAIEIMNPSPLN